MEGVSKHTVREAIVLPGKVERGNNSKSRNNKAKISRCTWNTDINTFQVRHCRVLSNTCQFFGVAVARTGVIPPAWKEISDKVL